MGGDASRNGADLFETEADFSAKIVTFRLVGGDASPPSPPLNPPLTMPTRGGVEDTRLEAKAKAKDTKKIRGQGQGQPFRGQTLSRPRTGMLEAKAKDQGHKAQVLSKKKKKGLHKNFSGDLQKKKKKRSSQKFFRRSPKKKKKKGLHKNFSGDLQKKKKKKKKVFTKIFQAISTKKRFPKNFSTAPQNFNFPKNSAVLEPRTGQFSRT